MDPKNPTSGAPENGSAQPTTGTGEDQNLILGKFKTVDDLAKSYQTLEAEFGKKSQEAKKAEKLMSQTEKYNKVISRIAEQQGVPVDDVLRLAEDAETSAPIDPHVAELKQKVAEMEFEKKHQNAAPYMDIIRAVANSKYDGNLDDALADNQIKEIIQLKEKIKSLEEGTSVIETNQDSAPSSTQLAELLNKAKKSNRMEDWQAYMKAKGVA